MKDIRNYENIYAITEEGQVWSYKSNRFLSPTLLASGYLQVELYKNGKGKKFLVHRLVAEAFLPNPEELPQVNHISEIKTDNRVSNLCWMTAKDNDNHGTRNKRIAKALAIPVYCVELDKKYESIAEAARDLNLSTSNLSKCLRKIRHTCGGYHWEYV